MAEPKTYHFKLPRNRRPDPFPLNERWYPGIRDYWGTSTIRSVDPIEGIRAIVIHATAGSSSEGAVSVIRDGAASFHWLVPDEDEAAHGKFCWACIPETKAAWHVRNAVSHDDINGGQTHVNHWSLGIEVVNSIKPTDAFSMWQLDMTAEIVRYCWAKYPNLIDVVSHAKLDPQRRSDPGHHFDWDTFRKKVLAEGPGPVDRQLDDAERQLMAAMTPIEALPESQGASIC
ncbi:N-acetyl-anhydromuramyl-L-alanine amidase AmpD [Amorphus suaedae]